MRIVLLIALTGILSAFAPTNGLKRGTLKVRIEGITEVKGKIGVLVFNQADGFPQEDSKAILFKEVEVVDEVMVISLQDLPYGDYALSVVHDVNSNQEFDRNFVGIPKEPFGFSNNKSIYKGLPDFEEAAVRLDQNQTQTSIKLVELF